MKKIVGLMFAIIIFAIASTAIAEEVCNSRTYLYSGEGDMECWANPQEILEGYELIVFRDKIFLLEEGKVVLTFERPGDVTLLQLLESINLPIN